jgi:protein-S-isoprenylcysteine O-methyltransferase Ste14
MIVAMVAAGVALRAGLSIRRARRFRQRRAAGLRKTHLRFAKPAVVALLIGFLGGPVSAVLLRNWEPIRSFHGSMGLLAAALFAAAACAGRRIERRRSSAFDAHALLGLVAMLAAVIAGVAGFVLLP